MVERLEARSKYNPKEIAMKSFFKKNPDLQEEIPLSFSRECTGYMFSVHTALNEHGRRDGGPP